MIAAVAAAALGQLGIVTAALMTSDGFGVPIFLKFNRQRSILMCGRSVSLMPFMLIIAP